MNSHALSCCLLPSLCVCVLVSSSYAIRLILDDICSWTTRLDTCILGPGLGKDPLMVRTVGEWLKRSKLSMKKKGDGDGEKTNGIVLDGDAIHVLTEHPELLVDQPSSAHASPAPAAHTSSSSSSSPTATLTAAASPFHESLLLTPNAMEFRRLWTKFHREQAPPEFNVPVEEYRELINQRTMRHTRHRV